MKYHLWHFMILKQIPNDPSSFACIVGSLLFLEYGKLKKLVRNLGLNHLNRVFVQMIMISTSLIGEYRCHLIKSI